MLGEHAAAWFECNGETDPRLTNEFRERRVQPGELFPPVFGPDSAWWEKSSPSTARSGRRTGWRTSPGASEPTDSLAPRSRRYPRRRELALRAAPAEGLEERPDALPSRHCTGEAPTMRLKARLSAASEP